MGVKDLVTKKKKKTWFLTIFVYVVLSIGTCIDQESTYIKCSMHVPINLFVCANASYCSHNWGKLCKYIKYMSWQAYQEPLVTTNKPNE